MGSWSLGVLLMHLIVAHSHCDAYNLLVISPLGGKSHAILGDSMVKHLLDDGNQITYITAFPDNMSHKNLTVIDVSEKNSGTENRMSIKALLDKEFSFQDVGVLLYIFLMNGERVLSTPGVQALLADRGVHFDAIIAEWMFSDLYAGFQAVYGSPFIWFSTVEPHYMILKLVDELPNPAYTPDCLSPDIPPFTFWRRVEELYGQIYGLFLQQTFSYKYEQQHYEKWLVPHIRERGAPAPSMDELRHNASLVLSNSHVSMGGATRLPPNYIPVGGFHIDADVLPLPENLQKLMDNANHGVIYFSMGSNLRSEDLPKEIKLGLLKVLGQFKQTVIWKFGEDLPNRPSNVHIVKWAPQPSILAHRKCALFITHGGLLSTAEAIHFGVPIVGIPVFADQFTNIERAVQKGFAKKVTLSYTMMDEFKSQIESVLNDPKYAAKAKELSVVYHDRVVPAARELVHWVRHAVRTRGAPHLRSPALSLRWYHKCYLDLAALLLAALLALFYALRKLYTILFKKSISTKKTN